MLLASAETIDGPRPCDWFDVFVDDQGDLVVLLLDVQCTRAPTSGSLLKVLRNTRTLLRQHEPLHSVVGGLALQLAAQPGVEAGLSILRLSARDAKVELLNAGMPAIAQVGPGGKLDLYPALSGPIGRRVGEVHAYELVPLVWGSTWLAVSDGMVHGSLDPENVTELCAQLDLAARGLSLAGAGSDAGAGTGELHEALHRVLSPSRFARDDATCVLVAADAGTRFKSGITA